MKATSQELQSTHVVIKNKALVYESYGSGKSVVPTRCDFFSPPRGCLAISPFHHWYRMVLQVESAAFYIPISSGPVEAHISYRCNAVHLSGSSKKNNDELETHRVCV